MRTVSATEAKNRFGALCAEAKRGPVLVEKDGRADTVLLSFEAYRALVDPSQRLIERRRHAFARQHRSWLQAYRREVQAHGVFSDGLRNF